VNVPPESNSAGAPAFTTGATLAIDAVVVAVLDAPWSYTVNWGDGRSTTGRTSTQGAITPSARYLVAGSYTVTLRVVDVDIGASEATTTVTVRRIPITIDIKPGSSDNPVKLIDDSDARIPVAVLSTASFDATMIDPATVSLASVNVSLKKNGSLFASMEDVNGDGLRDLVLHFARSDLVTNGDLTARTTALTLIGSLFDGRQVGGSDTVRPIP
jgi:hypothetical protein